MYGGSRLCMFSVDKFNTASHTWARTYIRDLPRENEGAYVVMDTLAPHITYSDSFWKVLSGATASNVEISEGLPLLSYNLGRWEKIFKVLKSQAQQTLMMLSE